MVSRAGGRPRSIRPGRPNDLSRDDEACPASAGAAAARSAAGYVASAQERPQRCAASASAEQRPAPINRRRGPRDSVLRLLPPDSVTEHSVDIPGGTLAYTATAGTLSLFDQIGRAVGRDLLHRLCRQECRGRQPPDHLRLQRRAGRGVGLPEPRPGRPANCRVRRTTIRRRPRLHDNPQTWLAFTDLVMIDPVGTGWSRPAKPDGGSAFYGVRRDAQALAKIIALYLAKNGRGALAEISPGRKLRRLSRRQGGARAAARAGHHRCPAS